MPPAPGQPKAPVLSLSWSALGMPYDKYHTMKVNEFISQSLSKTYDGVNLNERRARQC